MNGYSFAGVIAVLVLGGCSDPKTPAGNDANAVTAPAAGEAADPKPDRATAQAALDFVLSRLNDIDASRTTEKGGHVGVNWTPADVKFGSGGWSWSERNLETITDSGGLVITDKSERYAVGPRELSYPTEIKQVEIAGQKVWAVVLECATKDCIRATGASKFTSQTILDNGPTETRTDINDRRESNLWYFYDEAVAKRVAHAIDVVISYEGGAKRRF